MTALIWESSALVQRYAPEPGSATVHRLFDLFRGSTYALAVTAYAETYAALVRKRNSRVIDNVAFSAAVTVLQNETIYSPFANLLDVDFHSVLGSIALVERHNINSTDAAALVTILAYADSVKAAGDRPLVIVVDRRFKRAAEAEGLTTLNPEEIASDDVESIVSSI